MDDRLMLYIVSTEIDRAEWIAGSSAITPGAAMALVDPSLDNEIGSNWCRATGTYGAGERGTPGGPNDCVASATLVINEIDYDQPGTDEAEFVKLLNTGTQSVYLGPFSLELVNGTGGGAEDNSTIQLPGVELEAGGLFVVCGDASKVPDCDLDVSPERNLIQNGGPDAVALKLASFLIDTVS